MENAVDNKSNSFLNLDALHNFKNDHSKKCEVSTKEKHLTGFLKQSFRTLSVPKKSQSEKGVYS